MKQRERRKTDSRVKARVLVAAACIFLPAGPAPAAEVWTGPEIVFSRPAKTGPPLPQCEDAVSDSVRLTRAATRGLFNAVSEERYRSPSPADTEWAWDLAGFNTGLEITAANQANLTFNIWVTAHDKNPPAAVGIPGVLHLMSEDIYLDIEMMEWADGGGAGAFAYRRGTPGGAQACGDLDLDSDVDERDVWRLRSHLADPDGFPFGPEVNSCPVIGLDSRCDALDLAVMLRAVAEPPLGPGISPVCPAANAPALP